MLKKSFVLMMLLAASLVGISSAAHHYPEVAIAQPQPQQPQQQPQTQKQIVPGTQILGQAKPSVPGADIVTKELQEQRALADRLFPFIVQKLDGKTLAQKLDSTSIAALVQKMDGRQLATLLQKADGRLLAEKVLPHVDVTLRAGGVYSPLVQVKKEGLPPASYHTAVAQCPPGTRVTGGGGQISNTAPSNDNDIVSLMISPPQRLVMQAKMEETGDLMVFANCLELRAIVSLKPLE